MGNSKTSMAEQLPEPNPDLRTLHCLIGTWKLSGDTSGTVDYKLLEGGFFLLQHFDIHLYGKHIKGVEVIGHTQLFGQEPGKDIYARAYDNFGNSLDYVYEVLDDTLTIWGGYKGSPAYFKGEFSKDGKTIDGEWVYPNGKFKSTMEKINNH